MKLIKTASGKKIKMSKKEWQSIGKTAGWIKKAQFGMFNSTDYVNIGSTPNGEDCAQLGSDNYNALSRIEGRAYINQLKRMFPNPPYGVLFSLKGFPHDFGTYYEVVVKYLTDNEEAEAFAWEVQNESPENWDEQAKAELQQQGYFDQSKGSELNQVTEATSKDKILEAAVKALKKTTANTDRKSNPKKECQECHGDKFVHVKLKDLGTSEYVDHLIACPTCSGKGYTTKEDSDSYMHSMGLAPCPHGN